MILDKAGLLNNNVTPVLKVRTGLGFIIIMSKCYLRSYEGICYAC